MHVGIAAAKEVVGQHLLVGGAVTVEEVDKRQRLVALTGGEHGVGTVQRVQRLQALAHRRPTALRRTAEQGQQQEGNNQ